MRITLYPSDRTDLNVDTILIGQLVVMLDWLDLTAQGSVRVQAAPRKYI